MLDNKTLIIERLREKGYRLTPQRLEIINIISGVRTHPSARDLLSEVRKRKPKISSSTVYYTLNLLKQEGLIKEIEFYDKPNRYDPVTEHHINLICQKCGRIEDFEGAMPLSYSEISEKTGFEPHDIRYEYYGYCRKCKKKK
jgi:Fur family peroxide stress response transcriptional regulator